MKMILPILNLLQSFLISLILHELGHLVAARLCRIPVRGIGLGWGPKLFGIRLNEMDCELRLLPMGAYVRMDMVALSRSPLFQQLFVLGAGIAVNFILAVLTWGSIFSAINLALAIGNILPVYQHDGWKGGIVICRRFFGRSSPLVEWTFTLSGGLIGLVVIARAIFS